MLKLFREVSKPDSFEPEVTILDLSLSDKGLVKAAAHDDIAKFVTGLQPKAGHTYLHINAMTAGEFHGSNRNADYFPEDNLKAYYKTFMTSPAHVFRSHINKDPTRAYGKVIFAVYNDTMHRVELIAECPDELVQDINQRISVGNFPTTSMACKTPWDTCSICGNRARSRQEYCTHLKNELGKLYPDGRKVFAINDGPLTFFDISIVVRPADVNSSILQKVASDTDIIGSAELAEIEGLTEKQALSKIAEHKKWGEFIKEINEGIVTAADKDLSALLDKVQDLPYSLVETLAGFDINQVLFTMASMGISPSISFLADLIAKKQYGDGYEGIGDIVEEFIKGIPTSEDVSLEHFQEPTEVNPVITSALQPHVIASSLLPSSIEKRASGVGYSMLGPKIEPTEWEEKLLKEVSNDTFNYHKGKEESPQLSKMLLGLGVSALLAKYYINSVIDRKAKEAFSQSPQNNVKIILVKHASDYLVASTLSNASLKQAVPVVVATNSSNDDSSNPSFVRAMGKILRRTKSATGKKLGQVLKLVGIGINAHNDITS